MKQILILVCYGLLGSIMGTSGLTTHDWQIYCIFSVVFVISLAEYLMGIEAGRNQQ